MTRRDGTTGRRGTAPSAVPTAVTAAALGVLALVGLTACGGADDPVADTSAVAPMLLTDDDAPAGYSWNSVADVLADAGDDLGQQLDADAAATTTDPASCAALVPTSTSIFGELYDHRDTVGAVEFLPDDRNDPAVIDAVVSTADDGDTAGLASGKVSVDGCGQFSRTGSDGAVTHYRASSQSASNAVAQDMRVVTVLSDSTDPGENLVTTVTGSVDGVHFRVTAAGTTDPDLLTELAETQVNRIAGTMEGQD